MEKEKENKKKRDINICNKQTISVEKKFLYIEEKYRRFLFFLSLINIKKEDNEIFMISDNIPFRFYAIYIYIYNATRGLSNYLKKIIKAIYLHSFQTMCHRHHCETRTNFPS